MNDSEKLEQIKLLIGETLFRESARICLYGPDKPGGSELRTRQYLIAINLEGFGRNILDIIAGNTQQISPVEHGGGKKYQCPECAETFTIKCRHDIDKSHLINIGSSPDICFDNHSNERK